MKRVKFFEILSLAIATAVAFLTSKNSFQAFEKTWVIVFSGLNLIAWGILIVIYVFPWKPLSELFVSLTKFVFSFAIARSLAAALSLVLPPNVKLSIALVYAIIAVILCFTLSRPKPYRE